MSGISVIIPAYNRADLIGETLRSLFNQTVPAKEIIVVDDGSTDGTVEAVEREFSVFSKQFSVKFKTQNLTLKILRQQNLGPGAARNRGLAEATGEFIHFFDSDDIASPNKHEVQLQALIETGADIAYGPWVKGRFAPEEARRVASGEFSVASLNSENTRYQLPVTRYSGFHPEGPMLQAGGLPQGDLVKALLTNWSIVPHAGLFRSSILERVGGFPEDIWVGEDQLLFLRCLLAGAKVVHTPGTMVFYRLGNDPGKLTAAGAAQRRHARDWGKFLIKANHDVTTNYTNTHEREEAGQRLASQAGAAFSNSSTSELARDSENTSLTRFARGPAPLPDTSYALLVTTTPSAWFGFRLRAYEAWRDLEKFFPSGEVDLKNELRGIWRKNRFSVFRFRVLGFVLQKLGGIKHRMVGHRYSAAFRSGEMGFSTDIDI